MGLTSDTHRFFCMKCGNEGIPLPRKKGRKHSKFHRKKMYCPHCRKIINHIECRNEIEVEKFKEDFNSGEFLDEVEESLNHVRNNRRLEKLLN